MPMPMGGAGNPDRFKYLGGTGRNREEGRGFSAGQLVRTAGLEPARLTALPPQSSASANSATCATGPLVMRSRALCMQEGFQSGVSDGVGVMLADVHLTASPP